MMINDIKKDQIETLVNKLGEVLDLVNNMETSVTEEGADIWFGGLPQILSTVKTQSTHWTTELSTVFKLGE